MSDSEIVLPDSASIDMPHGVYATRTGLVFTNGISYDDWLELGKKLDTIEYAVQWWRGDHLNYGERKWGEMYSQALDDTGKDYGTLRNYKWVASQIELSRRRDNLGWSLHYEVASLPELEQDELLSIAENESLTVKELRQRVREHNRAKTISERLVDGELPSGVILLNGDMSVLSKDIESNSVDLVLTDPPYPGEFLYCWDYLAELAERVLKPSGFLIAYSGQLHLPEVMEKLNIPGLQYYWTMSLVHSGGNQLVQARNVFCGWKPLLVYQKEPFHRIDGLADVIQGTGREKESHDWQQSSGELDYVIDKFTLPGDLILDPFAGSGTTLIAAAKNKRTSIGIELDETNYKVAMGRIHDELQER